MTPIADAEIEGPETVVVTLVADPAYGLGLQTSATVTIAGEQLPNMTLSLVGSPVVGVGKDVQLQILLGQAAPPGGVTVTITSDDPSKLTVGPPATATIAAGGTVGFVTLHGISRGATTSPGHSARLRGRVAGRGGVEQHHRGADHAERAARTGHRLPDLDHARTGEQRSGRHHDRQRQSRPRSS